MTRTLPLLLLLAACGGPAPSETETGGKSDTYGDVRRDPVGVEFKNGCGQKTIDWRRTACQSECAPARSLGIVACHALYPEGPDATGLGVACIEDKDCGGPGHSPGQLCSSTSGHCVLYNDYVAPCACAKPCESITDSDECQKSGCEFSPGTPSNGRGDVCLSSS